MGPSSKTVQPFRFLGPNPPGGNNVLNSWDVDCQFKLAGGMSLDLVLNPDAWDVGLVQNVVKDVIEIDYPQPLGTLKVESAGVPLLDIAAGDVAPFMHGYETASGHNNNPFPLVMRTSEVKAPAAAPFFRDKPGTAIRPAEPLNPSLSTLNPTGVRQTLEFKVFVVAKHRKTGEHRIIATGANTYAASFAMTITDAFTPAKLTDTSRLSGRIPLKPIERADQKTQDTDLKTSGPTAVPVGLAAFMKAYSDKGYRPQQPGKTLP